VFGLDERIADVAGGNGLLLALAVAVLLGLRHATDPDHLTAVSTLVLSERRSGTRVALALGLSWGVGHALTLVALGVPFVVLSRDLPEPAHLAAELAIGLIVIGLGLRLLWRWHHGYLHVHAHAHEGTWHAHPHVHERADHRARHEHRHAEALGRTPRAAFGIGLVHGVGGSAGVGLVLIGAISDDAEATAALLLFAGATALSMAVVSAAFGGALARGSARRHVERLAPGLGAAAVMLGGWYALGALAVVPYAV
jgi:ABC-type nickel/cobalt efflux system permease component RcnA